MVSKPTVCCIVTSVHLHFFIFCQPLALCCDLLLIEASVYKSLSNLFYFAEVYHD